MFTVTATLLCELKYTNTPKKFKVFFTSSVKIRKELRILEKQLLFFLSDFLISASNS